MIKEEDYKKALYTVEAYKEQLNLHIVVPTLFCVSKDKLIKSSEFCKRTCEYVGCIKFKNN